jgi:hypothetical protein
VFSTSPGPTMTSINSFLPTFLGNCFLSSLISSNFHHHSLVTFSLPVSLGKQNLMRISWTLGPDPLGCIWAQVLLLPCDGGSTLFSPRTSASLVGNICLLACCGPISCGPPPSQEDH